MALPSTEEMLDEFNSIVIDDNKIVNHDVVQPWNLVEDQFYFAINTENSDVWLIKYIQPLPPLNEAIDVILLTYDEEQQRVRFYRDNINIANHLFYNFKRRRQNPILLQHIRDVSEDAPENMSLRHLTLAKVNESDRELYKTGIEEGRFPPLDSHLRPEPRVFNPVQLNSIPIPNRSLILSAMDKDEMPYDAYSVIQKKPFKGGRKYKSRKGRKNKKRKNKTVTKKRTKK
jgi:hypothetical protein